MTTFPLPHAHRRPARRGAAAVAFAIIAPILIAITLGMFEVTRVTQVKRTMADAVRDACRGGALDGTSTASVQKQVLDDLAANNIDTAGTVVTVKVNGVVADVATANRNDTVTVTVA